MSATVQTAMEHVLEQARRKTPWDVRQVAYVVVSCAYPRLAALVSKSDL
jgi:hypothetical protein